MCVVVVVCVVAVVCVCVSCHCNALHVLYINLYLCVSVCNSVRLCDNGLVIE